MNYLKSIFVFLFLLASFGISFAKENNHAFAAYENAAEFSVHKTPQISQTDQTEHFNCLRHSSEIDVFYFAKTASRILRLMRMKARAWKEGIFPFCVKLRKSSRLAINSFD